MYKLKRLVVLLLLFATTFSCFVRPVFVVAETRRPNAIFIYSQEQSPLSVSDNDPISIVFSIGNSVFTVNGVKNSFDTPPIIKNGRTLLPIRPLIESLNGFVSWSPSERKVTVNFGDKNIELWIGKPQARVNGAEVPIDASNPKVAPEIINGRTMLPIRFIGESLGFNVNWDENSKTVTITVETMTINLNVDGTTTISLVENATTGYTWHWTITDPTVVSVVGEKTTLLNNLIGGPQIHSWTLKGLKEGSTYITFKYYRNFEQDKIDKVIMYEIIVK
jgi:predicted secreted protein